DIGAYEYTEVIKDTPFSGGTDVTNYKLFSIPFNPLNGDADAVLGDDLGEPPSDWRLSIYDSGLDDYIEYGEEGFPELEPGLGFWLISRYTASISAEGTPTPKKGFPVELKPGWNMIGCPFEVEVIWDDIKTANPGLIPDVVSDVLYEYEGMYVMKNTLVPWKGYWVKNNDTAPCTMVIPYPQGGGGEDLG
ncbi:MAG: hypothetical protein SV062_02970, partial [Thermodesulfobacteriota bacterium]|nr:hypothetical protein [Thermodesulfobacteriota bacterium]